jgi:phenylalanyl-tRNA synthetase beta chain
MKFPIEWLKEIIPVKLKNAEIARVLTDIGLEVEYFDKDIMDVSIPANRADCASIIGIARELAAALNCEMSVPALTVVEPDHDMSLHIKIEEPEKCPRYISKIIANVNAAAKTPDFIKDRLIASGFKSISIIVDLTNYVMLETGQPLHAFDLSKITGKLIVRNANIGEEIHLLDDSKHTLSADALVIADDSKQPLALAGIMGCKDSGISLETTNIVLECAYFEPTSIRITSKNLKVQTDASFRFERGICYAMQSDVLKRITNLILQYAGGHPTITNHCKNQNFLPAPTVVILRPSRVATVIGQYFENNEIIDILNRLGFVSELISPRELSVTVPSFRVDVRYEVDLIEEISRIHGLNNITAKPPKSNLVCQKHPDSVIDLFTIKNVLMSLGYHETINYSFISQPLYELFDKLDNKIEVVNPISAELSIMRSSLLPGLLKVLQYNQNRQIRANLSLKVFEEGLKFVKHNNTIEQTPVIAGATYGRLFPKNWADSNQLIDFFDIKQDIVSLFKLGNLMSEVQFKPISTITGMHPGKTAEILLNSIRVGIVGAVHPEIVTILELKSEIICFEIERAALQNAKIREFKAFSKYPAVSRDIAMLVDYNLPAATIESFIQNTCGILLKEIIIFDVFAGKNVPEGKKSIALSLIFQDDQQTLNVEVVNDLLKELVDKLQSKFGAELRQ